MGLLKRHPDDGETARDSGSSGAEKDPGADYIEDVESRDDRAEAVDPTIAKRVVRKFDRTLRLYPLHADDAKTALMISFSAPYTVA